jgi:hypothetical protein
MNAESNGTEMEMEIEAMDITDQIYQPSLMDSLIPSSATLGPDKVNLQRQADFKPKAPNIKITVKNLPLETEQELNKKEKEEYKETSNVKQLIQKFEQLAFKDKTSHLTNKPNKINDLSVEIDKKLDKKHVAKYDKNSKVGKLIQGFESLISKESHHKTKKLLQSNSKKNNIDETKIEKNNEINSKSNSQLKKQFHQDRQQLTKELQQNIEKVEKNSKEKKFNKVSLSTKPNIRER